MGKLEDDFNNYRSRMNDRIMESANTNIKRFFALDTTTYAEGALDVKTKEMLGLVASMVLRCDDCIKYHLGKCHEAGVNNEEMNEVFMIAKRWNIGMSCVRVLSLESQVLSQIIF